MGRVLLPESTTGYRHFILLTNQLDFGLFISTSIFFYTVLFHQITFMKACPFEQVESHSGSDL